MITGYEKWAGARFRDHSVNDVEPREAVKAFADDMELVLRANDHKGGWRLGQGTEQNTLEFFIAKLTEEFQELLSELIDAKFAQNEARATGRILLTNLAARKQRIHKEAADVANLAMMIADNFGEGLPPYNRAADVPRSRYAGGPELKMRDLDDALDAQYDIGKKSPSEAELAVAAMDGPGNPSAPATEQYDALKSFGAATAPRTLHARIKQLHELARELAKDDRMLLVHLDTEK